MTIHGAAGVTVAAVLLLAGCTTLPGLDCAGGLKPAVTAELFFGRDTGGRESVSDAAWDGFVVSQIVPRFPDGFTVSDARGHWRGRGGEPVSERSKHVVIVLTGAPGEQGRLAALRAAYRARFHQDSVLLAETRGCAGF